MTLKIDFCLDVTVSVEYLIFIYQILIHKYIIMDTYLAIVSSKIYIIIYLLFFSLNKRPRKKKGENITNKPKTTLSTPQICINAA